MSLDINLNNILKHISDKNGCDDNPTPYKKPRYNVYMSGDGSTSNCVIKIDDIEHRPFQIYRITPEKIYREV